MVTSSSSSQLPNGLLLAGELTPKAALDALTAAGLPWLLINRTMRGQQRHVILDDERAAGLAVEHLVSLGHGQIAHLAGPARSDTAKRRAKGYRAAMKKAGHEVDPDQVIRADYTPEGGFHAMTELLASGARPTAVFVANLASAIGVLHALRDAGIKAPEEMSVVAVHDAPLAEHLAPALTTVRMPLRELGTRGVRLLSDLGPDGTVAEVVTGPMELVLRQSTAAPAR